MAQTEEETTEETTGQTPEDQTPEDQPAQTSAPTPSAWAPPEDALSFADIGQMLANDKLFPATGDTTDPDANGTEVTLSIGMVHTDHVGVQVRERLNNAYVSGLESAYFQGFDEPSRVPDDAAAGAKAIPRPHVHAGMQGNSVVLYLGDGFNRHQGCFRARGKDAKFRVFLFGYKSDVDAHDAAASENAATNSDPTRPQPLTTVEERMKAALAQYRGGPGHPALSLLQLSIRYGQSEQTIRNWVAAGTLRANIAEAYRQAHGKLPDVLPPYTNLLPLLVANNAIIRGGAVSADVVQLGVKAIVAGSKAGDVKKWAKLVVDAHNDARAKATSEKSADPDAAAQNAAKTMLTSILTPPPATGESSTSAAGQGVAGQMPEEPERPEDTVWDAMETFLALCATSIKTDEDGRPVVDWRYTAESVRVGVLSHFKPNDPKEPIDRLRFGVLVKQIHEYTGEILAQVVPTGAVH